MSRSYKKHVRMFMCQGNNTPYYKLRRRSRRSRANRLLRSIIANYPAEEIDDRFIDDKLPKEDQWAEPTDGHWPANKRTIRKIEKLYGKDDYLSKWYHKCCDKYLKPKHQRYVKAA